MFFFPEYLFYLYVCVCPFYVVSSFSLRPMRRIQRRTPPVLSAARVRTLTGGGVVRDVVECCGKENNRGGDGGKETAWHQ